MFKKEAAKKFCPLLKKSCIGCDCMWATSVRGQNGNTGEEVDEEACAISWLPMLLIENSRQTRSTAAATESFRNEMVKSNADLISLQALRNAQETHRLRTDKRLNGKVQ